MNLVWMLMTEFGTEHEDSSLVVTDLASNRVFEDWYFCDSWLQCFSRLWILLGEEGDLLNLHSSIIIEKKHSINISEKTTSSLKHSRVSFNRIN